MKPKYAYIYLLVFLSVNSIIWNFAEQLGLTQGTLLFLVICMVTAAITIPWYFWKRACSKLEDLHKKLSVATRRLDISRDEWMRLLKESNNLFDSFAMASWHYTEHIDFFSTLEDKIKNTNCRFRFFMLDPESEFTEIRENEEEGVAQQSLKQRIMISKGHLEKGLVNKTKTAEGIE